jgi:hypothetical protein
MCRSTFQGHTASTFAFPGRTPADDVIVTEIHTKDGLIFSFETSLAGLTRSLASVDKQSLEDHHKASVEAFQKENT